MAAPPFLRFATRGGRASGFLLTETLATFVISAFVLVGLASIAPLLTRAVDRSVASVQDVDDLGRTFGALQRDLSGLARARWDGLEPQDFVFRGGPNSVFFARREQGADGISETRVIALREIVADGGTRLVRSEARLPATAGSFEGLHFGPQRILSTGPARLRFWYVAALKGDIEPPRMRTWPVGPRLPRAILIEAVDAASTRLILAVRVPININAEIGCVSGGASNRTVAPPPAPTAGGPGNPTQSTGFNAAAWLAGATGATGTPPEAADQTGAEPFCGRDDLKNIGDGALLSQASKQP